MMASSLAKGLGDHTPACAAPSDTNTVTTSSTTTLTARSKILPTHTLNNISTHRDTCSCRESTTRGATPGIDFQKHHKPYGWGKKTPLTPAPATPPPPGIWCHNEIYPLKIAHLQTWPFSGQEYHGDGTKGHYLLPGLLQRKRTLELPGLQGLLPCQMHCSTIVTNGFVLCRLHWPSYTPPGKWLVQYRLIG